MAVYHFEFNQQNFLELSQEVKLNTSEINKRNDYYGQAFILKQYLSIPRFYSLKAILEHGIYIDDIVFEADKANLPIYFSQNQERAQIQERVTQKESIPIGFGYLYAKKIYEEKFGLRNSNKRRQGTIAFPLHSTPYIHANFDHKDYAEKLLSLPQICQPVYICLYYQDILRDIHKNYQSQGLSIVTCGHRHDPLFMLRLHDLCQNFQYSTSNEIGTHLFASVISGCNFFYTSSSPISFEGAIQGRDLKSLGLGGYTSRARRIRDKSFLLFSKLTDRITIEGLEFARDMLGEKHFKSRNELISLVIRAEFLDKFGCQKSLLKYKFPYFLRRVIDDLR